MTTPNDAARPVAWLYEHWMDYGPRREVELIQLDHTFCDSSGRFVKGIPLYTAGDYDALRAEVERLQKNADIAWEWAARNKAELDKAITRAEAAGAKVGRAAANLKFALDDRVNGQITYAGVCAINNALAALNEGDGE